MRAEAITFLYREVDRSFARRAGVTGEEDLRPVVNTNLHQTEIMRAMTEADLIQRYFDAFNAGDADGMAALVAEDVRHFPNQGQLRTGKEAFRAFLAEMERAYREEARDLAILTGPTGRVAAEFVIHGTYLETQAGLPEADGQLYVLPVGSFFEVADGRITRVSTNYNLDDWLRQVGG